MANLRRTLTKCKVLGWMEQITGHGFTGTYQLSFPFYPRYGNYISIVKTKRSPTLVSLVNAVCVLLYFDSNHKRNTARETSTVDILCLCMLS